MADSRRVERGSLVGPPAHGTPTIKLWSFDVRIWGSTRLPPKERSERAWKGREAVWSIPRARRPRHTGIIVVLKLWAVFGRCTQEGIDSGHPSRRSTSKLGGTSCVGRVHVNVDQAGLEEESVGRGVSLEDSSPLGNFSQAERLSPHPFQPRLKRERRGGLTRCARSLRK